MHASLLDISYLAPPLSREPQGSERRRAGVALAVHTSGSASQAMKRPQVAVDSQSNLAGLPPNCMLRPMPHTRVALRGSHFSFWTARTSVRGMRRARGGQGRTRSC